MNSSHTSTGYPTSAAPNRWRERGVHADVGRAAVELLLDVLGPVRSKASAPPQVVLPTDLVLRQSTGFRAAEG